MNTESPATSQTEPRHRYVTLSDGVVLHASEWGNGRSACLLIHGFGEGSHVWSRFAPGFAVRHRTLAVDMRGHGDSGWDRSGNYRIHNHFADMMQFVNSVALDRFVLIGHSLGADVAIRMAAANPTRVIGLGLIDFSPEIDREIRQHVRSDFLASQRGYGSIPEYAAWLEERRPLVSPGLLAEFCAQALRPNPEGGFCLKADPALGRSEASAADVDRDVLWTLLAKIQCPVMIVRGAISAVLSAAVAERMLRTVRNGCLRVIPNAGHGIMLDNPEAFANVVNSFTAGLVDSCMLRHEHYPV